jgi:hypothetical protein
MIEWVKILKESPIDWLLEKTNPSVRYFTLHDILDEDENDSQVVAAKTTKQWDMDFGKCSNWKNAN